MRTLRVLLVANTLPPTDISGVGEQVLQLQRGLREAGHTVEILGRGKNGARGPKILFPLTIVPPLLRALRGFRPEVVQVHESDGAFAAFLVRLIGSLLSPPPVVVALLQVSYVEELRAVRPLLADGRIVGRPGRVERRFRRWKAPFQIALGCLTAWLADVVLAPSARTAGEIEKDYQVRPVRVLPNVKGALPAATESGEESGDRFLFVGRLRIRKGVEVLLKALDSHAPGAAAMQLVIAGDGEHRAALEASAATAGLGDRVHFLGKQSAEEVKRLLATARALVVPSTYEGMPLVILEAMEAGVPVVASAVSGIPEVVVNGETGWLVPAESSEQLGAALSAAADASEARKRGQVGRLRLDQKFRPANAAAVWEATIEPWISSRTGRE